MSEEKGEVTKGDPLIRNNLEGRGGRLLHGEGGAWEFLRSIRSKSKFQLFKNPRRDISQLEGEETARNIPTIHAMS